MPTKQSNAMALTALRPVFGSNLCLSVSLGLSLLIAACGPTSITQKSSSAGHGIPLDGANRPSENNPTSDSPEAEEDRLPEQLFQQSPTGHAPPARPKASDTPTPAEPPEGDSLPAELPNDLPADSNDDSQNQSVPPADSGNSSDSEPSERDNQGPNQGPNQDNDQNGNNGKNGSSNTPANGDRNGDRNNDRRNQPSKPPTANQPGPNGGKQPSPNGATPKAPHTPQPNPANGSSGAQSNSNNSNSSNKNDLRKRLQNEVHGFWDKRVSEGRRWTLITIGALLSHGRALYAGPVPTDATEFCPRYSKLSSIERVDFWVKLISAVAAAESAYDPNDSFRENMRDRNGNAVVSRGLLQISLESANFYGCGLKSALELNDPATNIACGVKILSHWIPRDRVITSFENAQVNRSNGGWRGGARYWSTLRPTNKSFATIRTLMRNSENCRQH